jgi:hypothetical protein
MKDLRGQLEIDQARMQFAGRMGGRTRQRLSSLSLITSPRRVHIFLFLFNPTLSLSLELRFHVLEIIFMFAGTTACVGGLEYRVGTSGESQY